MQSKNHPDLTSTTEPLTTAASRKKRENRLSSVASKSQGKPASKQKQIDAMEVSNIIIRGNIKTRTQLLALAQAQREEGKTDLASFLLNNIAKKVNELIQTTWEMKGASAEIERLNKTRVELMQLYLTKDCIQGCEGQCLQCAKETLLNNQILSKSFIICE